MPTDPSPSTTRPSPRGRTEPAGLRLDVGQLLADIRGTLASAFTAIDWAEQEITAARRRHPAAAGRIWHSFVLLRPTYDLMTTEAVFRAHCAELLARVAADADTRPGTAAECCIALCETSQLAPLTHAAVGLYARMWQTAGLPEVDLTDHLVHYETLEGALIDDHEQWLRGKLRQPWRQLPPDTPAAVPGTPTSA
jgi:hypothetical protein